ncbi:MAG: transketolase, partial [Chloroflexaceae bacterium]|nr:transketolase [Chloroflexaceae bacterium]
AQVIFVYTHDSIGLGEDGPTHQPIEHLASLRAIPNLAVVRPADATETAYAWRIALERTHGPTALVFTRQNLPILNPRTAHPQYGDLGPAEDTLRGAYVLKRHEEPGTTPDVILMATGSEVEIVLEAAQVLAAENIRARVVSMPAWELFEAQDAAYRESVLPAAVTARVSIEAASPFGWERYVGTQGTVIGINHFGASAPYKTIYEQFGLTAQRVAEAARQLVQ